MRSPARAALAAGGPVPPLAGVPIAIKDVLHVEGLPTTCGSRILEGYLPPYTATAVARLEAAGAVVVGKTNMDEFAMGSSTENSAFGPTRNPWDLQRVPGGSSGGSAAARGRAAWSPWPLGHATPAARFASRPRFCGVVGLKPTYGRVSRYGLVAFGIVARPDRPVRPRPSRDVALLSASVIAGHDPRDSTSVDRARARLTLAALDAAARGPAHRRARGVLRRRASTRRSSARRSREPLDGLSRPRARSSSTCRLPHLPYAIATYYLVATAEASSNLARYDGVHYGHRTAAARRTSSSMYAQDPRRGLRRRRSSAASCSAPTPSRSGYYDAYYLKALKVRTLIKHDFEQAFEPCDVDRRARPRRRRPSASARRRDDPLPMYLADIYTVLGEPGRPARHQRCPAASSRRTCPIGLQLIGRPFDEATLLRRGTPTSRPRRHHELAPPL